MPSSPNYKRDYKQEYATAKARGEDKDANQRNKARRAYEAENGKLPAGVDVDHKRKIKDGGSNAPSNLRARPASENRSDNGHKPKEKK